MGGLVLAAFGFLFAFGCFLAETVPANWPFRPIKKSEKPGVFWSFIAFYVAVGLAGLIIWFTR